MAQDDMQCAEFLATFPAIQSAIKVYGDEQGMRVQLEIPESEMGQALKTLQWRGRVLRVTIIPDESRGDHGEAGRDG